MRRRRLGWLGADWQWTVLGIALILAFWEAYGEASNPFLFPLLDRVLDQLNYYVTSGELVKGVVGTLELLLTGLALGSAVGIVAGLILGSNRTLGEIFAPFLQAGYATPRIALIPLIIIWFGVSFKAQVVLVFLSCVFEVTAATEAGVREVGEHLFEVARSFRLPSWKLYHTIIIPGSVTYIISGIRLGLSHAFVGAIGAEIFMEASGVGDILKTAMQSFRTDRVPAIIVVLAAFSSILVASMRFAERRTQPWRWRHSSDRADPRSAVVFGGRALVVVIWLVSWQLVGQTQPVLLSYPSRVVATFGHVILNAQLPQLLLSSGRTFVIGWVIAVGGGIVLGVLIGWLRQVALMFEPFLNAVYATPLIALIPLMVLWFGLGLRALVACVVVIAIFPMLIMTITGVRNAGREYVEVARSFRLNRFKMLYKVVLPGAFPYGLVGLRLSTARAITGTIIAEFLIGSDGIGDALQAAGQSFATPLMFGLIITIVVFAMAVDTAMRRTTAALHMDQW